MQAWAEAGFAESRVSLSEASKPPVGGVIDVRQEDEFASGHLPDAHHVELGALPGTAKLPPGPLTLMCEHGERAMTGASVLERGGRRDLTVLVGGAPDWSQASGQPLVRS
jgi:rhodanese-related sulfurtransferase